MPQPKSKSKQVLEYLYRYAIEQGTSEIIESVIPYGKIGMMLWEVGHNIYEFMSNASEEDRLTILSEIQQANSEEIERLSTELSNDPNVIYPIALSEDEKKFLARGIYQTLRQIPNRKAKPQQIMDSINQGLFDGKNVISSQNINASYAQSLGNAVVKTLINGSGFEFRQRQSVQILEPYPVINGFEIKGILGEGAYARVYLANQKLENGYLQTCALKVGVLESEERFRREVQNMQLVKHTNVLSCWHTGRFQEQGVSKYWISMPNMGGITLEHLILGHSLDLETKLLILMQMVDGLEALHQKKIIHRDLKPSNCLISSDFELKISDFGLSKDLNQNVDSSHSRNAYAIGTPAYMSPESIDGKIGYYSDVWAFGMIAFELFSGDLPWGRDINPLVLIGNIQHKEIDVRKKLISLKLPTKLIDIIEQCLRREISKRYRDGMALKKDFYHWAKEERKRIRYSRFKKSWHILIEKELLETFVVYQVENGISNFRLDDFLNFSEVMILPEALDLEKLGDVLDILSQVSREIQLEDALGKQLSDEKIPVMINRLKLVIKEELKSFGKKGWERQGFWIRNVIIGGTILSSIIGGLWYRNETIKETTKEKKLLAMEEERRQKEAVIQKVKDDLQLILMTGGSFMMGHEKGNRDEKPMHLVHVKDFYMSKTEVTVGQYQQCVDAGICSKPHWDEGSCQIWNQSKWRKGILEKEFKEDNQPIVCVDWYQARVFAKWVGGDLPSEAQWEYASRSGGQDLKYPWGNQEPTCDLANFNYNCRKATSPVCSHPNGNTTQGLCDMGGNVWEWVLDEYHASYQDAPSEDLGWCSDQACESNSSTPRVHRGGAWYLNASYLRSTLRYRNVPNLHFNVLGFRVAFDLSLNPNR